jgi:hypothetical protein
LKEAPCPELRGCSIRDDYDNLLRFILEPILVIRFESE